MKKKFQQRNYSKKEEIYDLDIVAAFLCNAASKVTDLGSVENGKPTLVNGDIVFFNSLRHKSGQIWLTSDNPDRECRDGDDEQIIVKLSLYRSKYEKIVFIVQIYNGEKYNTGKSAKCIIRAVDGKNDNGNGALTSPAVWPFNGRRSMVFAELCPGIQWLETECDRRALPPIRS